MELISPAVQATVAAMQENMLAFSVDCVIFGYGEAGLKILLLECDLPQYKEHWSLLGDFVRPEENIHAAAHRVLNRYTGLENIYLEQVSTFGDPGRHPLGRVVTTAYYSLMKLDEYNGGRQYDGLAVQWFPVADVPQMAFDHQLILNSCAAKMRERLREHPIGFELLPKQFTLTQLQTLYEVVLGIELDKRNFRRKLRNLNLLVQTGNAQTDVSHRPANLYRFDADEYQRRSAKGFDFEI
jgi:8-oxo-dGTP diphosphatase